MKRLCYKCGNEYGSPPAISRMDQTEICPECGSREALENAVNAGVLTKEYANEILETLKQCNSVVLN